MGFMSMMPQISAVENLNNQMLAWCLGWVEVRKQKYIPGTNKRIGFCDTLCACFGLRMRVLTSGKETLLPHDQRLLPTVRITTQVIACGFDDRS